MEVYPFAMPADHYRKVELPIINPTKPSDQSFKAPTDLLMVHKNIGGSCLYLALHKDQPIPEGWKAMPQQA